ncbi:hypothetical protein ACFC18_15050 [Streptomyces sp. NPDC056121]
MAWATAVGRGDERFPSAVSSRPPPASRLPALDERLTGIAVTMF